MSITPLARNYTPFTADKKLDEAALRKSLQRFVDAKISPYLVSGGSSEANSLTRDEVRRIYEIGVEVCKGKVPAMAKLELASIFRYTSSIMFR